MTRPKYTVEATRVEGWWAIEVQVPGRTVRTQARRIDQINDAAREAIAMTLDVTQDSFDLAEVEADLGDELQRLLDANRAVASLQRVTTEASSELNRELAKLLKARGYTVRDSGAVLGVSPQRVSQLLDRMEANDRLSAAVDDAEDAAEEADGSEFKSHEVFRAAMDRIAEVDRELQDARNDPRWTS